MNGLKAGLKGKLKPEMDETPADEMAESPAKQKAEAKAGTEKHKGAAMKAMKMFQKQQGK